MPLPETNSLCPHDDVLANMHKRQDDFDTRLKAMESLSDKVDGIIGAVEGIAKQFRFWAPTIVGAAISAGIVNGKLGAFLHALLNGGN